MIGYETEEQQVQAIKQFWKDYGITIIVGAVIGLGLLWAWRYYIESNLQASEVASTAFQSSVESVVETDSTDKLNAFLSDNADTGYAPLAAMVLAQQAVENEDYAGAKEALSKAITGQDAVSDVARLRLADLHLQLGEADEAISVLNAITSSSFEGQASELQGDALMAKNDYDGAKDAYTKAIAQAPNNQNIKLKRDNIAYVKSKSTGGNVE